MVIPIKKSQSGLYNRGVQATIYKKESDFFVQQSKCIGTYEMDVQVPYRIFTPKYRRKIIYNQYRKDLGKILRELCRYKGVEILEGHLMPDHVHILVSIPPKIAISSFMGYLKGKSALMMFERHGNLRYKFGNRHFWSEGYYVSTVGLNEQTIRKYIKEQEKADMIKDKLSIKEYENPFKS